MIVAVILLVGVAVNVSSAIAGFTWTERKETQVVANGVPLQRHPTERR